MGVRAKSGGCPNPVYLALMIGPDMSGKTTFSRMVFDHFNRRQVDFSIDLMVFQKYDADKLLYMIKDHATETVRSFRGTETTQKKFILVDASDLQNEDTRVDIFSVCLKLDIIYLQIYMEFDRQDVIGRWEKEKRIIDPLWLINPEFYNTSCISTDSNKQFNSITIFKTFIKDSGYQISRLCNFLLNCTLPTSEDTISVETMCEDPLEYNNAHKFQMQAGISYKDKLLHGKGFSAN